MDEEATVYSVVVYALLLAALAIAVAGAWSQELNTLGVGAAGFLRYGFYAPLFACVRGESVHVRFLFRRSEIPTNKVYVLFVNRGGVRARLNCRTGWPRNVFFVVPAGLDEFADELKAIGVKTVSLRW